MTALHSLLLGLVQGITELLPISSSAHLVLIPKLFNQELQSTSFDIILHSGTLLALVIYFKNDLLNLVKNIKQEKNKKLLINLIITTIPAGVIGFLYNDFIEQNFKSIQIIVIMLILIGIIFLFIDKIANKNTKTIKQLSYKNSFSIGIAQIFAFLRGTSRSGVTILGGIFSGLRLNQAMKYSFLAGIPLLTGTTIYQLFKFTSEGFENIGLTNLIIGFTSALLTSLIAIKFMLSFIKNRGLMFFGIYRIILGIIILIFIL